MRIRICKYVRIHTHNCREKEQLKQGQEQNFLEDNTPSFFFFFLS